jgi:diketogulonate reductase-like aldo/keto reductase
MSALNCCLPKTFHATTVVSRFNFSPLLLLLLLLQVAAMGELIQAGKIKYWGLSNETTFGEHITC